MNFCKQALILEMKYVLNFYCSGITISNKLLGTVNMEVWVKPSFTPPVIAHRGASAQAPENTLAAFTKAKQLGLNWVEFDVMLTATGEVVVIHDDDLKRTTNGEGLVINYSYEYLKALDAGSWFSPKFSNQILPLLQEVLHLLHHQHIAANLEIKSLPGQEEKTVECVLEILKKNTEQLPPVLLLSSFSPIVLRKIRKMSSSLLLGMAMHEWYEDWQSFCQEVRCIFISINHLLLNFDRVKEIKEKRYLLLPYTVNDIERAETLLSWGVDAIFSDCPQEILSGLKIQGNKNINES